MSRSDDRAFDLARADLLEACDEIASSYRLDEAAIDTCVADILAINVMNHAASGREEAAFNIFVEAMRRRFFSLLRECAHPGERGAASDLAAATPKGNA